MTLILGRGAATCSLDCYKSLKSGIKTKSWLNFRVKLTSSNINVGAASRVDFRALLCLQAASGLASTDHLTDRARCPICLQGPGCNRKQETQVEHVESGEVVSHAPPSPTSLSQAHGHPPTIPLSSSEDNLLSKVGNENGKPALACVFAIQDPVISLGQPHEVNCNLHLPHN